MTQQRDSAGGLDYATWQFDMLRVGTHTLRFATKPGVFSYGVGDPSAGMLARAISATAEQSVVLFNCGAGPAVAAAAMTAARVITADRNVLAFHGAQHTLHASGHAGNGYFSHGAVALPADVRATLVVLRIPHERAALLQLLADAFALLDIGGTLLVAGAVHEGVKPAFRVIERVFNNGFTIEQQAGHRVMRAVKRQDAPYDAGVFNEAFIPHDAFHQSNVQIRNEALTIATRPGVFSWDHVDEATTMLADCMDLATGSRTLDLGCGAGVLGTVAARVTGGDVCMVDADSEAVRCATRTAALSGAPAVRVLASDITDAVRDEQFDTVISNPPFHVGKNTDLVVPQQFITQAFACLRVGGSLQLVANRTLPYEPIMHACFGNLRVLADGARFKVLSATR